MNKFILLICFIIIFSGLRVSAQNVNNINTFIPAVSENSGVNNTSTNYSPDYYTGRINYSVSLHNVNIYGINFSVGLNYSSNGIKVQEVSGATGLGWSSMLGGEITRQVRGLPDDYYYGYCGTARTGGKNWGALNKEYMQKVTGGTWDSQPDVFTFSFLGFTGSFVLDPDGRPILQSSQSGIKVDYCPFARNNPSGPSKFILRDQKGNQYFFEQTRTLTCLQHGATSNQYQIFMSSWSITKIITAYNKQIDFTYSSYNSAAYISYTNYLNVRIIDGGGSRFSCLGSDHVADATHNENVDISYQPIYLVKISGNGIDINLGYNLDRADLNLSRALTDISVNFNNTPSYAYKLNYSYFTSSDGTNTKRLKLNNISQIFPGGVIKTPYTFYYNEAVNLPARNSIKSDYLGYYNNNTQSSNIAGFADKTPNLVNSQANILQKVTNILGGSVNFEYELNSYSYGNNPNIPAAGLRVKRIYEKISDSDPSVINQTLINYNQPNTSLSSGQIYATYSSYFNSNSFYVTCGNSVTATEMYYSSESLESITDANNANVGYSTVTTTRIDGSFNRYTFTNFSDYPDMSTYNTYFDTNNSVYVDPAYLEAVGQWSNDPRSSYAFARGKVLKEEVIDGSGQPVKTTSYSYGLTSQTNVIIGIAPTVYAFGTSPNFTEYKVNLYTAFTQDLQLLSKTIEYAKASLSQQNTTESYSYTTYAPNLIRSITSSSSGGKTYRNTFHYPFDVIPSIPTSAPAASMTLTNLTWSNNIASPVEVIHSVIKNSQESVISANVTQYFKYSSYYLPHQEYKFENKYPLPISQYVNYSTSYVNNTEQDNLDTRLKPLITYINYDDSNNLSQTESPTGTKNYNAIIYGYNKSYKIAQATNASLSDVAYTSFESNEQGNWTYSGMPIFDIKSITGNKYYNLSLGNITKSNLVPGTIYTLTYWTKNSTYFPISGTIGSPVLLTTRNGWNEYQYFITGQTTISIAGSGAIDELRLYPKGAQMVSFTYIPFIGITSKDDENNQITYYEYDEYNRLQYTRDGNRNITSANCYSYNGEAGNCFISYPSSAKSGNFYKNNCGPGYGGSIVAYNVEAGRYSASSQLAADGLAQNDVDQHGQDYANANGTCIVQVVYARIEMENIITYPVSGTNGESSSSTRADVYIRLYTDAGCSNPFTLTAPLTVVVAEGYDYSTPYNGSASGVNNESFTMTATQSSLFVGNVLLSSYGTYIDPYSGSGYITESYSYSYDTAVSPNGSYTPAATYPN